MAALTFAAGAALAASAAFAVPPGGGEETAGNNLSVPAIFVPSTSGAPALRLPCGSPQAPGADGVPSSTEFPGYWLQKTEATWTAECTTASAASVVADWGDNLTTSPSLSAGKPVRVEVSLLDLAASMTGYLVENLTPNLADRLATYGTNGTLGSASTRVWDAGAHLTIETEGGDIVFDGPMTAEINSIGAVVYGYNWGTKGRKNTPSDGVYKLTFSTSNATTITGLSDAGANNPPSFDAHSTTLWVELLPANRGKGGGSSGSPGNPGGPGGPNR